MAGTDSFNLITEPWIPVLRTNGLSSRVGIRAALLEAGLIRQIAASNPLDNVALLRFLLAVLQWCKPVLLGDERAALDHGSGIPDPSSTACFPNLLQCLWLRHRRGDLALRHKLGQTVVSNNQSKIAATDP